MICSLQDIVYATFVTDVTNVAIHMNSTNTTLNRCLKEISFISLSEMTSRHSKKLTKSYLLVMLILFSDSDTFFCQPKTLLCHKFNSRAWLGMSSLENMLSVNN